MKKLLLFLITTMLSITSLTAQNNTGIIKGIVITSDNVPAEGVTIKIEHSKKVTITNGNGEFIIKNIKPGKWILKASSVANSSQEKVIIIAEGQTAEVNFILKESSIQMEEVIVSASPLILNKENKTVAKIPLKNIENPQVYSSVSSEIIQQQGITNYDDVMKNIPGMSQTWASTGRGIDGASYFALRGFEAQPALYNGLSGISAGSLDPADIEEVVVLKGPSGTLFGGSFYGYGGIINTITKKPYYNYGGELAYNFGSFGLNRITADINTPLSKKDKIAIRVNTAYQSENSFQDAGFKKSFFIAPSLVYEVNNKLTFNFLAEILEENRAVAPVFFNSNQHDPITFKTIKELNLNPDLSFTSNDLTIKNSRLNIQAQMVYKLSDKWTSQTAISRASVTAKGIYNYIWDDVGGDNWFSQWFSNQNRTVTTTNIQQNFNGDFTIAGFRNRLLIGLDYLYRNDINYGTPYAWARNVTPQGDVNYIEPFNGTEKPPVYLTMASINSLLATVPNRNRNISNSSYGAYISDVVNITPKLTVMLSVRADYYDSKGEKNNTADGYNQFALSPKFGMVYQPVINKISFFANYMNAFSNVGPTAVYDQAGNDIGIRSFKPEHANQFEIGVKSNLFFNKLSTVISYYDIRVDNRLYPDPTNLYNSLQGGKVSSKGFEIEVNAKPTKQLSLIAGYSYNKAKVVEGNNNDFYSEPGRNPGGQGPNNLANLWATYKFTTGKIKNWGIGFGGNYGSENKVLDNSVVGVFVLPSYTLVNGSMFYNGDKVRVTFNVNNIGNTQYYTGYWSVNPQKRRNFSASITFKF